MTELQAYHYGVMTRALDEVARRSPEQLSLEDLATHVGLSPAHFQRLFSHWVGVSPKRYQQYFALDHAKRLLAERHTVLEAAHATGLSGASRLHDLFLRWEAMSPGEFARAGDGLEIVWGRFDSPFGEVLAMGTDRGLCGLAFTSETGWEAAMADLRSRWPRADYSENAERLRAWVEAAFCGTGETRLHVLGAPFQIKVWEALLAIPSGHVTTYSDLAVAIGRPTAVRAVGTAVGRNPLSWLIPCHRAMRKSGGLGGYHWGLGVKRAMLAWEAARFDAMHNALGAAGDS
ncbi:MAG: bifunctional helix-turn-helix domain-containing protein/methylated-DNA--[protein]-cysteine S-methyltransferase [Pseudomonadota bacterium]